MPFALPTIVAGLVLLSLYGPDSPLGVDVANTRRAVFLAHRVRHPAVRRPHGAAGARGAGGGRRGGGRLPGRQRLTTFRRVILPSLAPAILAGAALSFARAISEYGSLVLLVGQPAPTRPRWPRCGCYLHRERQHRRGRGGRHGAARHRARRDRRARRDPATGGPPWLSAPPPPVASGLLRTAWRSAYLFFLVAWPVSLVVEDTFDERHRRTPEPLRPTPTSSHALQLTVVVRLSAVVINTVFGVGDLAAAGALRVPGQAGALGAHRPAAGGVADRGGARPGARLQRPLRLVRPDARGARLPGHLRHARAWSWPPSSWPCRW